MSEEDQDDKTHDPSQKRLDDARKRGEIAKSADLTVAASYAGLWLAIAVAGGAIVQGFGTAGIAVLESADRLAPLLVNHGTTLATGWAATNLAAAAALFAVPAVAVLLALGVQGAILFAPEKVEPKWSRISPLAIAAQKFGREGLFEFAKSMLKMIVVSLVLAWHLIARAPQILGSSNLAPALSMQLMLTLLVEFLGLILLISTVFGALDYLWQRAQHQRRNMMSRKDLMDEMKESEGDPHVKMQRRQRGQEIATNRMLQDVATADVIIVNPTHYAVALKWNRKAKGAPICVAKGVDEIAARIREKAMAAGVPLHSDPPTARAVFATVDLGQQILPEQYRAVAAAVRFAEAMRKHKKGIGR